MSDLPSSAPIAVKPNPDNPAARVAEGATYVDVSFRVTGQTIPLDHGYTLFGALSRVLPAIHERKEWGVHAIRGRPREPGILHLHNHSAVALRVPADDAGSLLPLVGKRLELDGHTVLLHAPRLLPLECAPYLESRFVTIKGFLEKEPFTEALRRQIATVPGLNQPPETVEVEVGEKRIMRAGDHKVVGFPVALRGLLAEGSVAVQRSGLGGRRHLGAGMFMPMRPRQ